MHEHIIELVEKLISVPSVKERPDMLEHVLNIALEELSDFYIKRFESNGNHSALVSNVPFEPGKKFKVILNAHLDVVEAKPEQFVPHKENGKLYGRGSYDMKAASAVMIVLFKNIAKELDYPIALQLVTDEEVGGFDGTGLQVKNGVDTEFVIVGECSTNFDIKTEAKGVMRVKITSKGRSAHGAYLWLGDNAVNKMNLIVTDLLNEYPTPKGEVWQTTMNISVMNTPNQAFNRVPDQCELFLDVRYIPEDKQIFGKIKEIVGDRAEVDQIFCEPAHYADSNSPFIQSLSEAVKAYDKYSGELKKAHGGSDLRYYGDKNIPAVEFGPLGGDPHGDSEWVDMASLLDYYKILENYLKAL